MDQITAKLMGDPYAHKARGDIISFVEEMISTSSAKALAI